MKQKNKSLSFDILPYSRIIIILLPVLVFISAIKLGFVYFDDDILILGNIEKLRNLSNIGMAFRTDAFFSNMSPYYRPLMNVSYMIDALTGGAAPGVYHFYNLVYHILTCLSLFWLLPLMGFNKTQALAATLVFSIHPTLAHAVLWLPARGDLLVTLFAIISFAVLVKYLKKRSFTFIILHILAFAAALFSKESGIFLPMLYMLFLIISKEKIFDKRLFLVYLGWVIVIILWYFLRDITIDQRPDSQRGITSILHNIQFLPEAVARLVFPAFLPVVPVFSMPVTIAGMIAAAVILYFILRNHDRSKWTIIFFGICWFIGFCLPNMYVRLTSANDSFEYLLHRIYLPSVGFTILLLSVIPASWINFNSRKTWTVLFAILIPFTIYDFVQQSRYKNEHNFWTSAIEYAPAKSWFYFLHGRYYFKQKDLKTYEELLLKANGLSSYTVFVYQLAMIYYTDRKDYVKAYEYFNSAFKHGHSDPEARENYVKFCIESAYDYFKRDNLDSAIIRCNEALAFDSTNSVAAYNMGIYLVNKGEKQKAASMWHRAIRNQPDLKDAYKSLCYYYQYDRIIPDSAVYFAEQYKKFGGMENLLVPGNK